MATLIKNSPEKVTSEVNNIEMTQCCSTAWLLRILHKEVRKKYKKKLSAIKVKQKIEEEGVEKILNDH